MSREDWRNKIAETVARSHLEINRGGTPWTHEVYPQPEDETIADAVLALIEAEGRVLWWCPYIEHAYEDRTCGNGATHRRGVFIELDKP